MFMLERSHVFPPPVAVSALGLRYSLQWAAFADADRYALRVWDGKELAVDDVVLGDAEKCVALMRRRLSAA
jgi:hypothetical protein